MKHRLFYLPALLLFLTACVTAVASPPIVVPPPVVVDTPPPIQQVVAPGSIQNCQGLPYTTTVNGSAIACTKFFNVSGVCGTPPLPGPDWTDVIWATAPWEPNTAVITITSADANLVFTGGFMGVFIGNSFQPDPVTPYQVGVFTPGTAYGLVHAHQDFPAGTGMQFPGANGITDPQKTYHLDAHGWCAAGTTYSGYIRIVYTTP
jgi:hypothetical protein